MSKKAYVGVNGVSKNVSNIYVGVNGTSKKVVKGYVGVSGVSKMFFASGPRLIPFTTNQAPTTWNNDVGENEYGTWTIETSKSNMSGYPLVNAFDGDTATMARWASITGSLTITLTLPENITICPSELYFNSLGAKPTTQIEGYDAKTQTWYLLSSAITTAYTTELSTTQFFNAFRITSAPRNNRIALNIYEIAITTGTIADER